MLKNSILNNIVNFEYSKWGDLSISLFPYIYDVRKNPADVLLGALLGGGFESDNTDYHSRDGHELKNIYFF